MIQKALATVTAWLTHRQTHLTAPVPMRAWTRYPASVQRLANDVLCGAGESAPALRQAVAAAADGGRGTSEAADVPETLQAYVHKVIHNAYKVTDQDVRRLRAAGYAEDEIFELTISAAVGASLSRLDKGLALLAEVKLEGAN